MHLRPLFTLALLLPAAGCSSFDGMAPASEPAFGRPVEVIAAEAKALHPFPQDLPDGGALHALAKVDYGVNRIDAAHFTGPPVENPQFWINRRYVLTFPVWGDRTKYLPFKLFFDAEGNAMPGDFHEEHIRQLEVVIGGTRYTLPFDLAD